MKREFPYRTKEEFFKNVDKTPRRRPTNSYDLNRVGRLTKAIKKYY